jgi:hypothetical protein
VATYTTSSLATGTHSITAEYAGDADFAAVTSSPLAEAIEDFTVAAASGSTSVTVSPGGKAVFTLAVTPASGTTLATPVTFSVSGLPTGATGTFSPATVAAGSGATIVTLTVDVPSDSASLPQSGRSERQLLAASFGLLVLPLVSLLRKKGRGVQTWMGMIVLGLAATALISGGCGGGKSSGGGGTKGQPQSYTLTITATSGSLSKATTVTLTVQ